MSLRYFCSAAAAALLTLVAVPALAVDGPTDPFELDGNPQDADGNTKDDWETLKTGSGSSNVKSAVPIVDPFNTTVYEGGDKDSDNLNVQGYVDNSVPEKDELVNAAAAAYSVNGDLVVYFVADRTDNNGDAFIGAWFFQEEVETDGNGGFIGSKTRGDILILTNFTGGGTTPTVEVLEWDPVSCPTKDSGNVANFGVGKCPAANLQILFKGTATCNDTTKDACAITNTADGTQSVWPYTPKTGPANTYEAVTFFEGGANLTNLLPSARCFASFLIETRASSSETAQLKDFVLGSFPLCKLELAKQCSDDGNVFDPVKGGIPVPWTVTLTNNGFGPVDEATFSDNMCTPDNTADDETTTLDDIDADGVLSPGETATWTGECLVTSANFDPEDPLRNGASAVADGGEVPVLLADSCLTLPGHEGVCFDACAVDTSPQLSVTKLCGTRIVSNGNVHVVVDFTGTVVNDSNEAPPGGVAVPTPLTNVQVAETTPFPGDPLELYPSALDAQNQTNSLGTSIDLDPGETAYFAGSYVPSAPDDPDAECASDAFFTDQVRATGDDAFTGVAATPETDDATCNLCINCSGTPTN